MTGRALMVQGCTSHAGKSYLTAALCRMLADEGVRVAPFKAQNMSNNAGVTPQGLEMGRAQLVQAAAARVIPDVRMNPVLLKPEADTRSQVVLLGRADSELSNLPWRERKPKLWPHVQAALHSLLDEYEVVVIEGAGSPAEVNLRSSDIVNMSVAHEADAAVLLAADIDRGGAFAHLLGTWQCLDAADRARLRGFILNKFRGDAALLHPAPAWLEAQTGVPVVGTVPMLSVPLPEEDGVAVWETRTTGAEGFVAIARLPRVSNLDEFAPLGELAHWVTTPAELRGARAIILPGSKSTAADLDWLRSSGLAGAIVRAAQAGVPVLGICGGLQMLGRDVHDPVGVETNSGAVRGLGLLDLSCEFASEKTTRLTECTDAETGLRLAGYEIHHGQTRMVGAAVRELAPGLLWRQGNVRGTYLHGLLENPAYLERFLGWAGLAAPVPLASLDARLDAVATQVKANLDWPRIRTMVGL